MPQQARAGWCGRCCNRQKKKKKTHTHIFPLMPPKWFYSNSSGTSKMSVGANLINTGTIAATRTTPHTAITRCPHLFQQISQALLHRATGTTRSALWRDDHCCNLLLRCSAGVTFGSEFGSPEQPPEAARPACHMHATWVSRTPHFFLPLTCVLRQKWHGGAP